MVKTYTPDAGDIVWIDFDPQAGHEQAKRRPGLVLTPAAYNRASQLAIICPLTSVRKPYPFAIATTVAGKEGAVLADQARSMDWRSRRAELLEKASPALLNKVRSYLGVLLGITASTRG